VSNVIIVVLSLVILVIITSNVILWSYQMNQLDWEKMQENIEITDVAWVNSSSLFSFHNKGGSTCHVVSIWVMNSTVHERYEADIFVNSGERLNYTRTDLVLPTSSYFVKVVTERGNIAVYSVS
jgi:hypothetical protein